MGVFAHSRIEAAMEKVTVTTSPVPLNAANASVNHVGKLRYMGGIRLRSTEPAFGGLSGLDIVSANGDFVAVSDRGYWFTGNFIDDQKGFLNTIQSTKYRPIQSLNRRTNSKFSVDAEAVFNSPGGSYYVSFERHHRVWKYTSPHDPVAKAEIFLANRLFAHIPAAMANKGIEAMTPLSGNRLLLLSEGVMAGRHDTGLDHVY